MLKPLLPEKIALSQLTTQRASNSEFSNQGAMIGNTGRCCSHLLDSDIRANKDMVEGNLDELEELVS